MSTMKISVTKPFKINSITDPNIRFVAIPACEKRYFAVPGIYAVDDNIASHWYVQNFATIVDASTAATQVYSVVDF